MIKPQSASNTMLPLPVPTKQRGNWASCQGREERQREEGRDGSKHTLAGAIPSVCGILHRERESGIILNVIICLPAPNTHFKKKKRREDAEAWERAGGRSKSKNRVFVPICQADCLQFGHADKSEPVVHWGRRGEGDLFMAACGYFTTSATHIPFVSANEKQADADFLSSVFLQEVKN